MVELKFDCKETEDYYWEMRKKLGVGRPSKWNNTEKIITSAKTKANNRFSFNLKLSLHLLMAIMHNKYITP